METTRSKLLNVLGAWDSPSSLCRGSDGSEEVITCLALRAIKGSNEASIRRELATIRRTEPSKSPLIKKINQFERILSKSHTLNRSQIASVLGLDQLKTSKTNREQAIRRILDCYLTGNSELDLSDLKIKSIPDKTVIFLYNVNINYFKSDRSASDSGSDVSSTDIESLLDSEESIDTPRSSPPLNFSEARDAYASLLISTFDALKENYINLKKSTPEDLNDAKKECIDSLFKLFGDTLEKGNELHETYREAAECLEHDPYICSWVDSFNIAVRKIKDELTRR